MSTPVDTPEHREQSKARKILAAVGVILAFIAGIGVGSAIDDDATATTPAICETALAESDRLIGLMAEGFTYAADAMRDVGNFDVAGVEENTRKIEDLQPLVVQRRTAYDVAKASCLAD